MPPPCAQLSEQQRSVPLDLATAPTCASFLLGCVRFKVRVDATLGVTKIEAHQRCALLSWMAVKRFVRGLAPCNGKAEGEDPGASVCVRVCACTQDLFSLRWHRWLAV